MTSCTDSEEKELIVVRDSSFQLWVHPLRELTPPNYRGPSDFVGVRRFVKVAEGGSDAVADKHVHHKKRVSIC